MKRALLSRILAAAFCILALAPGAAVALELENSPLVPLKLESPRDTMATFLQAMNAYREGVVKNDRALRSQIDVAVGTLDLRDTSPVLQEDFGRETAILLKEVIDRVIVIELERIPNEPLADGAPWRLRNTDIAISRVADGDNAGRYQFTKQTVRNARRYYERVQNLPYLPGSGMGARYEAPWLEKSVPSWLRSTLFLLPNWKWIGLALAILLGIVVKFIGIHAARFFRRMNQRMGLEWQVRAWQIAEKPFGWIVASAFWFFAIHALQIKGTLALGLRVVNQLVFSGACILIFYRLVDLLVDRIREKAGPQAPGHQLDRHMMTLLRKTLQVIVLLIGLLVVFQNLGINVVSLLAGLGLGGLAFALAAQDTCKNFFGSMMILLDSTYKIGDSVRIGQFLGTVEEVGFRSTRLRTVENTLISIPNSTVAAETVDNFSRRTIWRVFSSLGLTYGASAAKVREYMAAVERTLRASPKVKQDTITVFFNDLKADALEIQVECFLLVGSVHEFRQEREKLLLEFFSLAEKVGVEFAFPTRTVHVASLPREAPVSGR